MLARMNSHCASVSTPSAITRSPRPCAIEITTLAITASCELVLMSRTKDWSILTRSNGKRLR